MIKARNRKLSMLLVLAMLMTMFIGVGTASAAAKFDASPVQTEKGPHQTLGTVNVEFKTRLMESDTYELEGTEFVGEWLTIQLSDGAKFQGTPNVSLAGDQNLEDLLQTLSMLPPGVNLADLTGLKITSYDNIEIVAGKLSAQNTIELFVAPYTTENDASLKLEFTDINVTKSSGDINVQFTSPPGGEFPFMTSATIATIGKGSTTVMAKSVKTIGDVGGEMDTLIIIENQKAALRDGEVIEVKLPKGFTWDKASVDAAFAAGAWGFAGEEFAMWLDSSKRTLFVEVDLPGNVGAAGRVNISSATGGFVKINVDDNAKFGDVYVTVSSSKDSVKKQDVLVAVYGDYGVKVIEDTKEDVDSGRGNQELGEFLIEEALPESLDSGRSLYFELPKGVKWAKHDDGTPIIELTSEDGSALDNEDFTADSLSNGDRKVKVSFDFDGGRFSDKATKIRVEGMEVNVEPSFVGDIAVKVYGKAGVEGEAVVGVAARPVDLKVVNPTKVEIGAMNQAAGDILLIETKDEGILDGEYNQIVVTLPKGVEFYKDPVVEVTEGDLEIDDVDCSDDEIVITIDAASAKKSILQISEVFLTVDRTVPEGDVVATFAGHKVKDGEIDDEGSTALVDWATEESYGKVVIATTITPSQGGHAKFVIASNIYEIGGVPYVMDAVPYIKDSRSYVPMRYLAQMLGAEIEWSEADQTVTLTKEGETEVVFTIGSTSYTVNGEAMTADVAPEIVNDRSFLPARFAAEAFGAKVGWDEATQTVIIVR